MKVTRLDGEQLNFWVAKSEGLSLMRDTPQDGEPHDPFAGTWHPKNYHPSTDWSQGGHIMMNGWYDVEDMLFEWFGADWPEIEAVRKEPLKWFMRAYVASKFGDEVEDDPHGLSAALHGVMDWAKGGLKRLSGDAGGEDEQRGKRH